MSPTRIVFTRFASAESAKLAPWREHRRRVVQDTVATQRRPGTQSAVVWQLISANNRELARSADVFDDFQDAVVSAREAVDCVATDGEVIPVSSEQQGSYGWYIRILGFPAVMCSRWYVAERERRQAVALTLELLPTAQLASGARQYVESTVPPLRQLT